MDGRASIPAAWPPPFDENGGGGIGLFDLGGDHYVRAHAPPSRRRESGGMRGYGARCWRWRSWLALAAPLGAATYREPPALAEAVPAGLLPPVDQRLPAEPSVVSLDGVRADAGAVGRRTADAGQPAEGHPDDGRLRLCPAGRLRPAVEARARPAGRLDVEEDRIFTLQLRHGHRWSDGHPFTAEDFRFYWEDIVNNDELSPGGPERFLLVDGQPPRFEVLDETTVRYTWDRPNPFFLPALAGARPEYIFAPAHSLKPLHPRYRDQAELKELAGREGQRNWAALFNLKGQHYRNDNPDLPTLEPWMLVTKPPSSRFVFARNPYYPPGRRRRTAASLHRQGGAHGGQPALIPAKSAAGDADLQARGLGFENYTILKQGENRNDYHVRLWRSARGAELALYPNLNAEDPRLAVPAARSSLPPRAVAGDRPPRNQPGHLLRPGARGQRHGAAGEPALSAGVRGAVGPLRSRAKPTACSTRSALSAAATASAGWRTADRWSWLSRPPARTRPRSPSCS